ncbi:hypothetical protein T484DRAFT_1834328, partial [Baffinella frigidus]
MADHALLFSQLSLGEVAEESMVKEAVIRYKRFLHLMQSNEAMVKETVRHPSGYAADTRAIFENILPPPASPPLRAEASQAMEAGFRAMAGAFEAAYRQPYLTAGTWYRGAVRGTPEIPEEAGLLLLTAGTWYRGALRGTPDVPDEAGVLLRKNAHRSVNWEAQAGARGRATRGRVGRQGGAQMLLRAGARGRGGVGGHKEGRKGFWACLTLRGLHDVSLGTANQIWYQLLPYKDASQLENPEVIRSPKVAAKEGGWNWSHWFICDEDVLGFTIKVKCSYSPLGNKSTIGGTTVKLRQFLEEGSLLTVARRLTLSTPKGTPVGAIEVVVSTTPLFRANLILSPSPSLKDKTAPFTGAAVCSVHMSQEAGEKAGAGGAARPFFITRTPDATTVRLVEAVASWPSSDVAVWSFRSAAGVLTQQLQIKHSPTGGLPALSLSPAPSDLYDARAHPATPAAKPLAVIRGRVLEFAAPECSSDAVVYTLVSYVDGEAKAEALLNLAGGPCVSVRGGVGAGAPGVAEAAVAIATAARLSVKHHPQ